MELGTDCSEMLRRAAPPRERAACSASPSCLFLGLFNRQQTQRIPGLAGGKTPLNVSRCGRSPGFLIPPFADG